MKKNNLTLPTPSQNRRGLRIYATITLAIMLTLCMSMTALAAPVNPLEVVDNLSNFIFGFIRAVGLILLGFGILQFGLSLKSQDPSQRATSFLTIGGGIIIVFTKEILSLITG